MSDKKQLDVEHKSNSSHRPLVCYKSTDNVFKKTIKKWGVALQVTTAMEECGELIAVMNQYFFRARANKIDLAPEIADVEIVCLQLRDLIGDDLVDELKHEKMERLKKRVDL